MSKKSVDEEVADQCRIVDMMLSMHARLGHQLAWRATAFDVIQLIGAAVLVSTSFFDPLIWATLGLPRFDANRIVGLASTVLLVMAIVALRLNWANQAGVHERAAQTLAKLKIQLRWLRDEGPEKADAVKKDELSSMQAILVELPPIPPRRFNGLKAHHLRKVAVSKLLDKYPGVPVGVFRVQLFLRDIFALFRQKNADGGKNT